MKALKLSALIITLFLSFGCILGQQNDSVLAVRYFEKGQHFRGFKEHTELTKFQREDTSYKYMCLALPLLKKARLWKQVIIASQIIARYKYYNSNAEEAILFLEALVDTLKQNKVYKKLDHVYLQLATLIKPKSPLLAIDYLGKAIKINSEQGLHKVTSNILNLKGDYYLDLDSLDKAFYYYNSSVKLKKKLGLSPHASFKRISNFYKITRDYNLALTYLDSAVISSSRNILHQATYTNDQGAIYNFLGDYDKALEYCERAIKMQLSTKDENYSSLITNYYNVAVILNVKGDFIRSNEYLHEAISLKNRNRTITKRIYNLYELLIDNHLSLRENKKALEYVKIFYSLLKENQKDITLALNFYGQVYFNLGKYDSSLVYYTLAGPSENNYDYLGDLYFKLRKFETSRSYYFKNIEIIAKQHSSDKHPLIVKALKQIGDSYYYEAKFDSAKLQYEKVLEMSGINQEDSNEKVITLASDKNREIILFQVFWRIANIHRMNFENTGNKNELRNSHTKFVLASELLSKYKLYLESEKSKLFWSQETVVFFDQAIDNALFCAKHLPDEQYKLDAFRLIEMSKVHILKGSIDEFSAKNMSDIPDSVLSVERNFRITLNSLILSERKELQNNPPDKLKLSYWGNEIFRVKRDYSYLIKNFETQYPDYYRIKYEANTISTPELQERLNNDQIILQYYVASDKLHIMLVDKNDVYSESYPIDSTFFSELNRFISLLRKGNLLRNKQRSEFINQSHSLYKILMEPVQSHLSDKKELIIIPGGVLLSIPFEVLISENSGNTLLGSQRFLIKNYIISYQYSATLGFDPRYQKYITPTDCFTGFAPSFKNTAKNIGTRRFSQLYYNEEEIKQISSLFKKHNKEARTYLGSYATEENLKALTSSKYVHIATHSIADEDSPELSALYLSEETKDSSHDGILYSDEIFGLKLNSDLVVLSSCETGNGKLINGEGVLALTRGFIYNGIPNILFSLWEVSDRSTSSLMIEFYKNILSGKDYKSSLRDSKLKMLNNEFTSFPDKWGAFILIGK